MVLIDQECLRTVEARQKLDGTFDMEDNVFHFATETMNVSDGNAAFAINLGCAAVQARNGQTKRKSAAQKKREKRSQRRKAAAVLSQITITENVSPKIIGCRSVLTVEAAGEPLLAEGEESTSIAEAMELEIEDLEPEDDLYSMFGNVFKTFECVAEEMPGEIPAKI